MTLFRRHVPVNLAQGVSSHLAAYKDTGKLPDIYLSISCYWLDQILIITPGSANLEFEEKKTKKTKQQKLNRKQTNKQTFSCVFD